MALNGFSVALCVLLAASACRKEEKRVVRTAPWPAPAVSITVGTKSGATAKYVLESGSVQIELRGKRTHFEGKIQRLEGTLSFDASRVEKTRGSVRADLLDLHFGEAGSDDEEATLRALRALELTAERPVEERERDRWAELRIIGFDAPPNDDHAAPAHKKAPVTGLAELTLHRFRVPLTLELDVEPVPASDLGAARLRVRTRRPLVVQLAAHDLLPGPSSKTNIARGSEKAPSDSIREARVSAELSWQLAGSTATLPTNP